MTPASTNEFYSDFYKLFNPKTPEAKILLPLLDALNWQGDNSSIIQSLAQDSEAMSIESLIETMANLNFRHYQLKKVKGKLIDPRTLPLLLINNNHCLLILKIDNDHAFVFNGDRGIYSNISLKKLHGTAFIFQYADDIKESLIHQQKNWFNKLIFRFKDSLLSMTLLTLLMTLLDLVIPIFIIIIYDQIAKYDNQQALLITYLGVLIYTASSYTLGYIRSLIINYMSTRMGAIISLQTFTRLMYLSPSYTETASISAQINRIKDFENLKRFVTSGIFINILELLFSIIYVVAIFLIAGWLGFIPIITLIIVVGLGLVMRPFHKIRMERASESSAERQQNLIELLKNTDEIKSSGQQAHWIKRNRHIASINIFDRYQLSDYVNQSNSLSYFITNASVLVVIYGGVLQVFDGKMSMGALIGVILIYWKVLSCIRGAFSLSVQVNGLIKSIGQINRFMKLPQDNNLKTNMRSTNDLNGHILFKDVSIRYNQTSKPALFNVNFTANPGEIIGLSGHDGAGKTTILKLILGMYKPQGGRILLDGINLKQLEPLSLRRSISYAPEKDTIFSGTIRENFKYYNPTISDESIEKLISKTGLQSYMTLFDYTLDSYLSEDEIQYASMSFKKLFNLTRVLSRETKIYLVDEPENYLSPNELKIIMSCFEDQSKENNATIIISTKDPQLLAKCNQVIFLNQGRISPQKK